MTEKRTSKNADSVAWMDETETVLHTLHQLIQTTTSPVVKACLEEAHEDIAYLTACDTPVAETEEQTAVA